MALNREDVKHIALLARVGISDEEVEHFREQLSNILDNFQILQQVNTTSVQPTGHAIEMINVLRPDSVLPSLSPDEVLDNAPKTEDGCFRVRAVLDF